MNKANITPETYQKMNEEFIEDDIPFRIKIPTQEAIDKHRNATPVPQPVRPVSYTHLTLPTILRV